MAFSHPPVVQELGLSNMDFVLCTQIVMSYVKVKVKTCRSLGAIIQDCKTHTHLLFFKLLCRVY